MRVKVKIKEAIKNGRPVYGYEVRNEKGYLHAASHGYFMKKNAVADGKRVAENIKRTYYP